MPETFKSFKENVKRLAFPGGLAKPLNYQIDHDIVQALIYIQRWVKYYKRRNRNVFPFCSTFFACGASVVPKPRGQIDRLYTLQGDCCPIYYDFEGRFDVFMNWLNYNRKAWTEPANEGMAELPTPFKFAEDVTDKGERFNYGRYSIKGDQIFIGHRIESSEKIVIDWTGIRRDWDDDTLLPYDDPNEGDEDDKGEELRVAVAAYVRAEDLRKNRNNYQGYALEKQVFDNLVAEMKQDDHTDNTPKPLLMQHRDGGFEFDQLVAATCGYDAECNPEAEVAGQTIRFANIGDYGDGEADAEEVAEFVNEQEPDYVTTNGDNWYGTSQAPSDFEEKAAQMYRNFIFPYHSFQDPKLVTTALQNRFWALIGNHDRDPDGRLATEMALFNFPKVFRGGQLQASNGYYNVRPLNGFVEHFMYDSGYDNSQINQQADGVDLNTAQAVWLQTALAQSTARWKIVHMHHPGYTSFQTGSTAAALVGDGTLSYAAMRRIINKLKLWGADLVFCGHIHNYERLNVMGLPVINNGAGGRPIEPADTPIPFSVFQDGENHGACFGTATCTTMTVDFYSKGGILIDTLELTKAA